VEITAPAARDQWEVPDYVAEPEFDESSEADDLSLADELLGARQQARRGREDS
jgi:hypothetical protein